MKVVREHINEKFEEKSDPVRDMGIGAKPDEVFQQFIEDFVKEFRIEPFIDYSGHVYEVEDANVYLIQGQHEEKNHPVNKLIESEEGDYELNFARTDKSANAIVKGGKWGFYYWNKGKAIELQSKDLHGVIKEIIKIRRLQRRGFVNKIQTYKNYILGVKKIIEICDESS